MKKSIVVLAFLAASLGAFASGVSKIKVATDSSATFKVYYTNTEAQKVTVNIFNKKGKKVFTEVIKNEKGFVRPYNMSELPAGVYSIQIIDNQEVKNFDVEFKANNNADSALSVFINNFGENKFFLGMGNGSNDKVTIRIINSNNEELYTADEVVVNQFAQLFNIASANKGVTFQIFKGDKLIKETSF